MAAPQQVKIFQNATSPSAGATVDTGANATIYSHPMAVNHASNWAIHLEWTGTPTTAITLWTTCKPKASLTDDTDWVQDTSVTFTGPAGSASKSLKEIGNAGAYMYRLKAVTSSGSGTLSGWFNGK